MSEKERNCEVKNCRKKAKMNVCMPTAMGMFESYMCIQHGLIIHDTPEIVMEILKRRAKNRNISLPIKILDDKNNMDKLMKKEVKQ